MEILSVIILCCLMNVLESLHQKQENDADLQKDVRYAASEVMTVNSRMNETENTTDAAGNAKKSPAGNSPSAGNAVTPISVPLASAGNGSANVSALNRLMDDQDLYLRPLIIGRSSYVESHPDFFMTPPLHDDNQKVFLKSFVHILHRHLLSANRMGSCG